MIKMTTTEELKLIGFVARNISKKYRLWHDYHDIFQDIAMEFYNIKNKWRNRDDYKLSTYFLHVAYKMYYSKYIKKRINKYNNEIALDDPTLYHNIENDIYDLYHLKDFINKTCYGDEINIIQDIMEGYLPSEISRKYGVSTTTIYNKIKKCRDRLKSIKYM